MTVRPMRLVLPRILVVALMLALVTPSLAPPTQTALADVPCTRRSDNLTRNGSITDGGYDTPHGTVANSWNPFLLNGDWPDYNLADNESANGDIGGSSSQYIHGDGIRFDAGIYQVVTGTTPGASYDFSVGWAAMLRDTGGGHNIKVDDQVIRKVGVDPTGGTDPTSQNMQWGNDVGTGSSGRSLNNPDMRITFKALTTQVTVFIRVFNLSSSPSDKVFLDVLCVTPRTDIPVAEVIPTATETPLAPPTVAATPRPAATERPTAMPKPPTATPIPPTNIPAQVLTSTPELVALDNSTATPTARHSIPSGNTTISDNSGNTIAASNSNSGGDSALSFAVIAGSVGIIGIALLGIVLIGGFVVWRIFRREVDDALDPAYYPDDQIPYQ
jgi:hypothetical protein